ncbi:TfoX/Sxy family protein [Chitinophaga sp. 30R24]|uniref:TfoX/Sxy family protein n=1 Tax=Chitinophaga sp. 30R24 TaxID=3248838 RepID=UPI003B8F9D5C
MMKTDECRFFPILLSERFPVREVLSTATSNIIEKKMFGELCFMVNDKMCVGVGLDKLMVRIDPSYSDEVLASGAGCELMIHGGKEMKGFTFVEEAVLHTQKQLQHWIKMALKFNKNAKSSSKK